jgi:hypothetical protein
MVAGHHRRSTAMFTIQLSRSAFQSVACLLLAVIIVSGSLTIGAVGVQSLEQQAIAALAKNA